MLCIRVRPWGPLQHLITEESLLYGITLFNSAYDSPWLPHAASLPVDGGKMDGAFVVYKLTDSMHVLNNG
jgi:hypothetical protein